MNWSKSTYLSALFKGDKSLKNDQVGIEPRCYANWNLLFITISGSA